MTAKAGSTNQLETWWSSKSPALMHALESTTEGLAADEAAQRLVEHGSNVLVPSGKRSGALHELVGQFKSPIMLLLIFAAVLSAGLRDLTDATVILGIVVISGVLGFWQEHAASRAVAQLTSMIEATVPVMRTGQLVDVALADLVPGDPVKLTAGR